MYKASQLLVLLAFSLPFNTALAQESVQESGADAAGSEEPTAEADAESPADTQVASNGVKTLSGMSILGNEEAPKSLVIVPWKSSELGDGISVNDVVDERARPVDKDVFLREIRYYELRSGATE
jgi:hypothetical protein